MISEAIQRNATNLLKTGVILLLSNIATQTLRETTNDTMHTMARDIRRIRTDIQDRRVIRVGQEL